MKNLNLAEKQLVSALLWFRSRYALYQQLNQDRRADKSAIESFGKDWIGSFKEDWTNTYTQLEEKGILEWTDNGYAFTKQGLEIAKAHELQSPFYQYEYDNYFEMQQHSNAHHAFCERVYGSNLAQHGLVPEQELAFLLNALQRDQPAEVLDLGCGSGDITQHIAQQIEGSVLGVDISPQAIQLAKDQYENALKLRFAVDNMNKLALDQQFDAILSLDTFYYAANVPQLLADLKGQLRPGGKLYVYFSQWIMEDAYADNLKGDQTYLANALKETGLSFKYEDLTKSGLAHWKLKAQVLEEMKAEFEAEGHLPLWKYRYQEAHRYANWGDSKYARYFYEVGG